MRNSLHKTRSTTEKSAQLIASYIVENGAAGGGGGRRQRHYASDDRMDSTHLRDFLRIKENNSLSGLTLGAVLTGDKSPGRQPQGPALIQSQSNRTLMDIIRDDPNVTKESKKRWKTLKNKLRLRRTGPGAAWTSTVPIPVSDIPIQPNANRMISRRGSVRFPTTDETQHHDPTRPQLNSVQSSRSMLLRRNTSRIPERQANRLVPTTEANISAVNDLDVGDADDDEGTGESSESSEAEADGEGEREQPHVRMSLMALLAETDREMGLDGNGYLMDDDEEEEEEEEEEVDNGGAGAGGEYNCCVCMVRHKGSAFIPCGHTFCRLCSRELWVQRGNCPLCNNFILEILDIF